MSLGHSLGLLGAFHPLLSSPTINLEVLHQRRPLLGSRSYRTHFQLPPQYIRHNTAAPYSETDCNTFWYIAAAARACLRTVEPPIMLAQEQNHIGLGRNQSKNVFEQYKLHL